VLINIRNNDQMDKPAVFDVLIQRGTLNAYMFETIKSNRIIIDKLQIGCFVVFANNFYCVLVF
jgi:hypothetical protein